MSFLYKSMTSRGPGKRKIKLQEENILRLMQEENNESDEEDRDFEVDQVESDGTGESATSDSRVSTTDSDIADDTAANQLYSNEGMPSHSSSRKKSNHSSGDLPTHKAPSTGRRFNSNPVRSSSVSDTLSKLERQFEDVRTTVLQSLDMLSSICCICLNDKNKKSIITCFRCGVSLHKGCYSHLSMPHDNKTKWICDSCSSGRLKECELCPSVTGCLKQTSTGQFCHVICARYIIGEEMWCDDDQSAINFASLNTKLYGAKECLLCEDRLLSKTGICVKCDAGLCKSYFHVTCAQKHGLLSENESDTNNETDPYFVYCPLHLNKEDIGRSMKMYVTAFALVQERRKSYECMSPRKKKLIEKKLADCSRKAPVFAVSSSPPPPRSLASNAAALRLLNHKAERMFNIDVRSPAVYFPRPSEVRKRHRVAPALTPEFASHYVDRELRIAETAERLEQSSEENQRLLKAEAELRKKYVENQKALQKSKQKREEILTASQRLIDILHSLQLWSDENLNSERFTPLKLVTRSLQKNAPCAESSKSSSRGKSPLDSPKAKVRRLSKSPQPDSALLPMSLVKSCAVCHGNHDQHLLVECDVCRNWIHLGCLDPPLTQMPKKTKFSLWQCSECAPTSGDSDTDVVAHGMRVTAEGRRVTRRSHRPPDKLSTSLLRSQQIMEHRKKVSYFSRAIRKAEYDKRRLLSQRLRTLKKRQSGANPSSKNQKPDLVPKPNDRAREATDNDAAGPVSENHLCDAKPDAVNPLVKIVKPKVVVKSISPKVARPPRETQTAVENAIQIIGNEGSPKVVAIGPGRKTSSSPAPAPCSAKPARVLAAPDVVAALAKLLPNPSSSDALAPGGALNGSRDVKFVTPMKEPITLRNNDRVKIGGKLFSVKLTSRHSVPGKNARVVHSAAANAKNEPLVAEKSSKLLLTDEKSASASTEEERRCETCKSDADPQKMMTCSVCSRHYHIWCCDPPIHTVPRSFRYFKWECSNCSPDSENDKPVERGGLQETSDGRKKITRKRKPPEKFTNTVHCSTLPRRSRPSVRRPAWKRCRWDRRGKAGPGPTKLNVSGPGAKSVECVRPSGGGDASNQATTPFTPRAVLLPSADQAQNVAGETPCAGFPSAERKSAANVKEASDSKRKAEADLKETADKATTDSKTSGDGQNSGKSNSSVVSATASQIHISPARCVQIIRPSVAMATSRQVTVMLPRQIKAASPKGASHPPAPPNPTSPAKCGTHTSPEQRVTVDLSPKKIIVHQQLRKVSPVISSPAQTHSRPCPAPASVSAAPLVSSSAPPPAGPSASSSTPSIFVKTVAAEQKVASQVNQTRSEPTGTNGSPCAQADNALSATTSDAKDPLPDP